MSDTWTTTARQIDDAIAELRAIGHQTSLPNGWRDQAPAYVLAEWGWGTERSAAALERWRDEMTLPVSPGDQGCPEIDGCDVCLG